MNKINELPSAQPEVDCQKCIFCGFSGFKQFREEKPEQRWIPMSEQPPKESGKYYVSGGGKVWICEYIIIPNFIGGWCNDAENPVVQAWMPRPEPYGERSAE